MTTFTVWCEICHAYLHDEPLRSSGDAATAAEFHYKLWGHSAVIGAVTMKGKG